MRSCLLEELALGAQFMTCPSAGCYGCGWAHLVQDPGNPNWSRIQELRSEAVTKTPGMVAVLLRQGVPGRVGGSK